MTFSIDEPIFDIGADTAQELRENSLQQFFRYVSSPAEQSLASQQQQQQQQHEPTAQPRGETHSEHDA